MTQGNKELGSGEFKLIFIMYVGALAVYSYWSQDSSWFVKSTRVPYTIEAHVGNTNEEFEEKYSGFVLNKNEQKFVSTRVMPDWANKNKIMKI
jgi:hypothetical protein